MLEQVFKGAATTVVMQRPDDPVHNDDERRERRIYRGPIATHGEPTLSE